MKLLRFQSNLSRTSQAFTLLEILVAVSIFALVIGAINTVFFSAIHLRDRTTEVVEKSLPIEFALSTIKHDLANIVTPGGVMTGTLQSTPTTNLVQNQVGPFFYSNTGQPEGGYPWGDIQRVCYLLSPPANRNSQGKDLNRVVVRNLLSTVDQTVTPQWLMSGVESLTFTYYDGQEWAETWDTTLQTNLPSAIKVQIQMVPQQTGNSYARISPYELVIPMDLQTGTNALTATNTTTQ